MRAITLVALQAQQVADRWHLLKNMTELLERLLVWLSQTTNLCSELGRFLAQFGSPNEPVVRRIEKRLKNEQLLRAAGRQKQMARYEQIRTLSAQGVKIAQRLKMSRMTVRQFVNASTKLAGESSLGSALYYSMQG